LCDALPKLHLVSTIFDKCDILLPLRYQKSEFATQSLQSFPEVRILYASDEKTIKVPYLHFVSPVSPTGNFNEKIMNEVRLRLLDALVGWDTGGGSRNRARTRVYVSRAKAGKRRIVNEVDVVNMAKNLGYRTAYMEDLPFRDQVELMQNTKILFGLHGSGLTNMLFMPAGSVIVEIRRKGDRHNNCFFALACALGHEYYYITARALSGEATSSSEDVIVDVEALSTLLRQLPKRGIHD
jgi:capsular polysaccharide biosynthesis protein